MSDHNATAMVACLLDVSASMSGALEPGPQDEHSNSKFYAVIAAALKFAKAEQQRNSTAYMFVGVFGLKALEKTVDLCGIIKALDDERPSHEALIDLANECHVSHITQYIRDKLTAEEARILHACLKRHPLLINEFISKIPGSRVTTTAENSQNQSQNQRLITDSIATMMRDMLYSASKNYTPAPV